MDIPLSKQVKVLGRTSGEIRSVFIFVVHTMSVSNCDKLCSQITGTKGKATFAALLTTTILLNSDHKYIEITVLVAILILKHGNVLQTYMNK